jgi:quercetin dioxygenase-like cupin family protein
MHIVRFTQAERYEPESDWVRVSLCNQQDISLEHFVKPPNHASPRHSHPNAQVLVVLRGALEIITDEEGKQLLNQGDAVYIPGNQPHIVKNALDEPSVGLDIFVPGRDFDFWLKRK